MQSVLQNILRKTMRVVGYNPIRHPTEDFSMVHEVQIWATSSMRQMLDGAEG